MTAPHMPPVSSGAATAPRRSPPRCRRPISFPARRRSSLFVASFPQAIARWDERGYRLTLISAGAVARELGLVAAATGLGSVVTAAFYDREIDRLLGLDGVMRSTLLVIAVGAQGREQRMVMGGSEALG